MFFFILFFLVGLGVALQPGVILAGNHIAPLVAANRHKWTSFLMAAIAIVLIDTLMMRSFELFMHRADNFVYMMLFILFFACLGIYLLTSVVMLLQLCGIVDFLHGERNLQFYYDRLSKGVIPPSREDRYIEAYPQSIKAYLASYMYMLTTPFRSMAPYLVWILGWKIAITLLKGMHSVKFFSSWASTGTIHFALWGLGEYVVSFFTIGYLAGHLLFHHNGESTLKLPSWFPRASYIFSKGFVILSWTGFLVYWFMYMRPSN